MRLLLSHILNNKYSDIFLTSLLVSILGSSSSQCRATDLVILKDQCHDVDIETDGTTLGIITTGNDPYIVWKLASPLTEDETVLSFEYFSLTSIDSIHGYHGPPIEEQSRFELPNISLSEGWSEYRYDLRHEQTIHLSDVTRLIRLDPGMAANKRFQLRNPKLTKPNSEELIAIETLQSANSQKKDLSVKLGGYLKSDFPAHITNIEVFDDSISLKVIVNDAILTTRMQLVEFPLWIDPTNHGLSDQIIQNISAQTIRLPRFINGRDRLDSGWRIKSTDESDVFLSARCFPSRLDATNKDHKETRKIPRSKKGLSGVSLRGPLQDLLDLNVNAITINVVLNQFISNTSGPGRIAIPDTDPELFFDPSPFQTYDRIVEFASENEIVVSAIVLIASNTSRKTRHPLIHPDSQGGIYAMPDLSSESGYKLYRFILNAIAKRYGETNPNNATITNWVAHNEIDYHHVWTNMGKQPANVVTEIYYRSMRLIETVARRHNPSARVFASYTHHWYFPDDDNWTRLCTRNSLLQLQRLSNLEGDFNWGIAHHPYPENLFSSKAWEDRIIQFSLDTPMITIQNLEILGQFIGSSEMKKANGQVRPVILSEQGFHTPDYEDHHQMLQAASLWYAMQKVDSFDWIESFYYHRWIDHPDEGGLKLGLRTLPSLNQPYGEKKKAWYLYRAIGTDEARNEVEKLPLHVR